MKMRALLIGVSLAALQVLGSAGDGPQPLYWPTCPSPRPIAPMQALGVTTGTQAAVASNGVEYAVAYCDSTDNHFYFQRCYADGTPAAPRVQLSTHSNFWMDGRTGMRSGGMVWNGSSYALVFSAKISSGYYQVFFVTVTVAADGTVTVSEPLKVSHPPDMETCDAADAVLAWGGTGYAVVWCDYASGFQGEICGTLLDAGGGLAGTLHDIPLSFSGGASRWPAVTHLSGFSCYAVAWVVGTMPAAIYYSSLATDGSTIAPVSLVPASTNCWAPSLAGYGNGFGMAWSDGRDASMNGEIYFALFNRAGGHLSSDVRLSLDNNGYTGSPFTVWTGAEFDVFYTDAPADSGMLSGRDQVWQRAVTAAGASAGACTLVTAGVGYQVPSAVLGRYGFLVGVLGAAVGMQISPVYVQAVGCVDDATPPTCPGNFLAYNVTGTGAMFSWSPSGEDWTDLAYYRIYRDNVALGVTGQAFWADTGLTLGTIYNYMVQPVNAAQLQNFACTNALNLQTNATLTLMMRKNDPAAHLDWTGCGTGTCAVFRGTVPQVMQKIGERGDGQFDDPSVLTDGASYFYTVDEPGW